MFRRIIIITAFVFSTSSFLLADFPVEEVWSVEFDTTVTCLGPNWQEDGQTFFLVGLQDKAVIVSEGDIVWESPTLGGGHLPETVTAVSRIDFGVDDGHEIIVSTIQTWDWEGDEIYADSGKVYLFSGEDYQNQIVRVPFFHEFIMDADFDERWVRSLHVFSNMLPDTSKRIVTCNEYWGMWYHLRAYRMSGNIFISGEDIQTWSGSGWPVTSRIYHDGEYEHLISASVNVSWDDFNTRFNKQSMVGIYNRNLGLEQMRVLGSIGSDTVGIDGYAGQCNMYGMEIISDQNNNQYLYVVYSDTIPRPRLARLSMDDLATEDEMFLPPNTIGRLDIHHFPWGDQEQGANLIVCITSDGRVVVVDPVEMIEVERGSFDIDRIGSDVGNFDDDELFELVYLSHDALYLYDVAPMSAPPQSQPTIPTTFSIQSAYPNPFNSRIRIAYTLPRAGRYGLTVYDVNGAEITRLADDWRLAGSYRTAWNAIGIPSGTYFIKLGVDGQEVTHTVHLVK